MLDYYDIFGEPIEMNRWAELFEDVHYQRVALTEIDGLEVSTVWLGINQNFGHLPPLIFETMVFSEGRPLNYLDRYSTHAEAVAGHEEMVARVTADLKRRASP